MGQWRTRRQFSRGLHLRLATVQLGHRQVLLVVQQWRAFQHVLQLNGFNVLDRLLEFFDPFLL